jgi:hypothetical protein
MCFEAPIIDWAGVIISKYAHEPGLPLFELAPKFRWQRNRSIPTSHMGLFVTAAYAQLRTSTDLFHQLEHTQQSSKSELGILYGYEIQTH